MRLIDADALTNKIIDELRAYPNGTFDELNGRQAANLIGRTIDESPTVNVLTSRILDLDELQFHPHVWYEISNGTNPIPALVVPPRTVTRQRIVAYQPVFDAVVYLPENDCYKRTWRCWSAEPTEKQRKAAKWNED